MPTVKELKQRYRDTIKGNKGVNYFELQKALSVSNPELFDGIISIERSQASTDTRNFINKATTYVPRKVGSIGDEYEHPDYKEYAEHSKLFCDKFGNSEQKVYQHFLEIRFKDRAAVRAEEIAIAETEGKKQTEKFLSDLKNCDPVAVAKFKKDLKSNIYAADTYFYDSLYKRNDLVRIPERNESYEASVTAGLCFSNEYEQAACDSLKELFELKFAAEGYKGSEDVLRIFKEENIEITGTHNFKPLK